jgi:hypothetical protein
MKLVSEANIRNMTLGRVLDTLLPIQLAGY